MRSDGTQADEAVLNIKVIRKNGDVENIQGRNISVSADKIKLIKEYEETLKKLEKLKQLIMQGE